MENLLSTQDITTLKLQSQQTPEVVFADFDGTLFTAGWQIITAPIYNRQTNKYLKKQNIPFILVTGRSDWADIDKQQASLAGFPFPDTVVTAAGTIIYHRMQNKTYTRDMHWESLMHYSKVTWQDGSVTTWNKPDITQVLKEYLTRLSYSYSFGTGNTFLIRIKVDKTPLVQLEQMKKDILSLFPSGIKVIFTEKLLWDNTEKIFSGDILITPKLGGKENAVKYLLELYAKELKKPIHAFILGDATVDVGMLTMKENPKYFTLSQHGVHLTPLAKKALVSAQKTNPHLYIHTEDGPQTILYTLQPHLKKTKLSAAQNNQLRNFIQPFEKMLNQIMDRELSPNEISFLGLTKLSEGLDQIYERNPLQKIRGFGNYSFGNLTDVLDGIRARNSEKKEENGQLVDGFSDRAKEFMQLFIRAKRRVVIANKEKHSIDTFLTALSCALPSIARAQVEITGNTVPERDEKGGSMIDRTKKLFMSLIMDTIGAQSRSLKIDEEIYSTNIATFKNRLSYATNEHESKSRNISALNSIQTVKLDSLNDFQKKALERWLLYIDVLQQENKVIEKYLAQHPILLKEYEKGSSKLAKEYLVFNINKYRKQWNIKDYKLSIKKYLL